MSPTHAPVYLRPNTVRDACSALAGRRVTLLAGGTDYYATGAAGRPEGDVLDLTAVAALRGIRRERTGGWKIGATTTWSEVLATRLPPAFDALKQAAREVGGVQIQNAGTVAGNLCNASPAADGVPPLLALDASIELASTHGTRTIALREFILGPRKTALAPDELVAAVRIPSMPTGTRSGFLKLGARRYLVISIATVAVVLEPKRGRVASARVAVGSCSPVAQRLHALETALAGAPLDGRLGGLVRPEHLAPLAPIDDVRGSAGYRSEAALELVRRLLERLS